jgi:DNA polymerase-1
VDSRKTLKPVFDTHGIRYGQTELGNASFTEDSLAASRENPIVATVLAHRRALKRSSSYWLNFLDLEHNGIIHPSINQNKAQTGRMSISDPSCQNWSTDEDEGTQFPIRRAFIARPGCVIASLDYSQMELRKGADEADDFPMIERIVDGADLHQEIADMADVRRSLAKNGRFAKQYGAGIPKIAATLGVTEVVARKISDAIDRQAQAMTAYSYGLAEKARGSFGYDWLGRRFYFDPGFEYKAFNYRIQGGCAEILKIAILDIADFLKQHASEETFMLIPVHDELIANMHKDDLHLLPEIKRLMIEAHRDKKSLAMDVNVAVGPNIHDLEEFKC